MVAVGISPYVGLEPDTWRNLLSRAAVFHAVRAELARLCDAAERVQVVRTVLDQLGLAAKQAETEDADDAAAVHRVVQTCHRAIDQWIDSMTEEAEARQLLAEFHRLAGNATVEDPFGMIFDRVQGHASELYGHSWRSTRLSVAQVKSHPRQADLSRDPYPLRAETAWPPGPESADVELQIYCDKFSPAAYASMPMFLIHELVCHVPARQDKAGNDSEFAEGFMDWAAYHFLELWAGKLDRDLAPAARTHAGRLRQVLVHGREDKETRARQLGHRAAENLLVWFEYECSLAHQESRNLVALLAVQLNQVDRPLHVKNLFVSQLGDRAFPPSVEVALRSWVNRTQSADRVLDVVHP